MKKYTFCIFLFVIGSFIHSQAQIERIGLLPAHIKIIKKTNDKSRVWEKKIDPSNINIDGLEQYEKKYLSYIEKEIQAEFKNKKVKTKRLKKKEITTEDKNKEEELNDLIWQEYVKFRVEEKNANSRTKKEKKVKQTGELTEPLTTYFSEKLSRRLLLVTQIRGHHTRKVFEEREDKPYPEEARGNIVIHGLIIEAKTGKIVKKVKVKMSKSDTKFTPAKLKRVAQKYARAVRDTKIKKRK